jgi:hypothetical protein
MRSTFISLVILTIFQVGSQSSRNRKGGHAGRHQSNQAPAPRILGCRPAAAPPPRGGARYVEHAAPAARVRRRAGRRRVARGRDAQGIGGRGRCAIPHNRRMQGRVAAAGSGRVPDGTVPRLGIAASAHTRRPSAPTRPVEQVPTNGARSDAAGVVVRSSLPRNSCARRTAATLAHVRHQPADILGGSPADMRSLPACWASTSGPCLVVPRYHGGCILMRTHPPRSNCSEAPATVSHRLVCAGLTRGASGLCDRYWRNFQRKAGELIVTPGTPNCWQVQVPANDPASEKERWCGRPMPVPRQRGLRTCSDQ